MRISDWSSDVCSSDLVGGTERVNRCVQFQRNVRLAFRVDGVDCRLQRGECVQAVHVAQGGGEGFYGCGLAGQWGGAHDWPPVALAMAARAVCQIELSTDGSMPYVSQTSCSARSEEHTSELQSLMRISYA